MRYKSKQVTIRFKGSINSELTGIGLEMIKEKRGVFYPRNGVVHFQHLWNGVTYECSVWPEDYEIIIL